MPKARAGQAARKKQQRERAAQEHREEIAAQAATHAPERTVHDGTGEAAKRGSPMDTGDAATTDLRPVSGIASGPNEDTTVMADLAEAVTTVPETASMSPSGDVGDFQACSDPEPRVASDDTEPRFAPVPQPTRKDRPTMTDDSPAPAAPRGRMTDRYTVWSRAARGPVDSPAETQAAARADSTERAVGAVAPDAADVPGVPSVPTTSAGYDLAVTRLNQASAMPAPGTGAPGGSVIDQVDDRLATAEEAGSTTPDDAVESMNDMDVFAADMIADAPDTATGVVAGSASAVAETDIDATETTSDAEVASTTPEAGAASLGDQTQEVIDVARDRAATLADDARTSIKDATPPARETVSAGFDEIRGGATAAASDVGGAGRDIAATVAGSAESAREEIAGTAADLADTVRTAGHDLAAVAEERLDEAEDRLEETVDQVVETSRNAAAEIAGTVSRTAAEIREDLAQAAQDLVGTGRETVGDARRIAADAVAGARSGVAGAASSIGGTAQETAGVIGGRVKQATQSVSQTVSGTAGSVAGLARGSGTGGDTGAAGEPAADQGSGQSTSSGQATGQADLRGDRSRLIIMVLVLGMASGFTRWAIRRLTGTDIALLGPGRIRPAILGPGIAALVASLYLSDESRD